MITLTQGIVRFGTDHAPAPEKMAAPVVVAEAPTSITVSLGEPPASSRPITSYNLRYSTDGVNWTAINGLEIT